jgi:hypothetical protein
MEMADTYCNGRLVSVLEGGYADRDTGTTFNGIAQSALAHIQMLLTGEIISHAHWHTGYSDNQPRGIIHDNILRLGVAHSRRRIAIYNASGKQVYTIAPEHCCDNTINLGAMPLARGRYSVQIEVENGQMQSIAWIKEH